ncbi:MAG: RNA binding S1 domain protein [Candidatus Moranbacteria bacterium GW2011_GWA2_39_41]|nr:MAG: RNA binding S1 domain protein [Candidatus Moranbacteria bacterium GW2011_GWA2_39_41]
MTDILDRLATEVDKIKTSKPAKTSKKAAAVEPETAEMSVMEQLLASEDMKFPKINDVVEGTVIEVGSNAIYLDIDPFGTGIVLGREIKDGMGSGKLKEGDRVSATIMDLENEDGYIELSVREASYEKAWEDIESKRDTQEKIGTKVLSANKGGLLVEVNGISGFLPVSQLSSKNYPRVDDGDKNKILTLLKKLVGQELNVRILDANRESEKLIVSEKAAQSEKDRETISNLKVGDVVDGEISGVVDFGVFVKFTQPKSDKTEGSEEERLEGLVHISELAWQLIENPRDIAKVGDKVQAKIIGIDNDKISLSIRALQKDPWSIVTEKYNIGDVVEGTVNRINPFGAFVYLDRDIHGLAHVSEMSEMFPGKNIDDIIKVGDKYDWKILSIEPKEHRMGLSLVEKKEKKAKKEKKEKTEEKEEKIEE